MPRIKGSILGRRAARQSLARPVTLLRSRLTRRPAPGVLLLGFTRKKCFTLKEQQKRQSLCLLAESNCKPPPEGARGAPNERLFLL